MVGSNERNLKGLTPVFKLCRVSGLAAVVVALLLTAGCSTAVPHAASTASERAAVSFPELSKAVNPEGVFVSPSNLRQVAPGMTKTQLYALLGAPHFDEGVFGVTTWNYIFDFRKVDGEADYSQCQYQITFDKKHLTEATHWKPESCRYFVEKSPAAPAPSAAAGTVSPPASAAALLPDEPIRLSADALFAFNSAELTEDGRESLGRFMQEVLVASQLQDILVVGYTDRIGSDRGNLTLSQKRAGAVQGYLVQGGVPTSAIRSEGRGDASPVVMCSNADRSALITCLSPNRRVELSGRPRR